MSYLRVREALAAKAGRGVAGHRSASAAMP